MTRRGRAYESGAAFRPPLSRPVLNRRPGGAPGGAAPVQRASQPRWIGRRASRAGVATPFVRRAIPEPRKLRQGVSQAPGASRRSILVQNGNRERAAPRPLNSRGGGALAEHSVASVTGLIADRSLSAVEWIFVMSHVIFCS